MDGRIDPVTLAQVKRMLVARGKKIRDDLVMEGADVVFEFPNGQIGYADVEVCNSFYGGEYRSPKFSAVSVPLRKAAFLQTVGSFWIGVSRDKKHFIAMNGHHILQNSRIETYPTKVLSQVTEHFLMMPLDQVEVTPMG
jgi:hypothetical protein